MNETLANQPTMPDEPASESYQEGEYSELVAEHFKRHPEQVVALEIRIVTPEVRECGLEVEKLEGLMSEFEARHPLAELNAIGELSDSLFQVFENAEELENPEKVEASIRCLELNNPGYIPTYREKIAAVRATILTPEDVRRFEIRRAAMKDERVIAGLLEQIRNGTDVSQEKLEELRMKTQVLFKAVGFFKKGDRRIGHDR